MVFLIPIALIALHVLDDNFLQPEPGTSAVDHLLSGLVPLALLALAAWAYPRLRGGARAALAATAGVLGIAAGVEGFYYAREVGPTGDDFTGLLCLPAGVLLIGLGAATLWRSRRTDGTRRRRYARRGLVAFGAVLGMLVVGSLGYGHVTTRVARAVVPPDRLGVAHEDVRFTTADGLELEGWYIPSRNGAAVISFPGRKKSQEHARMLARHGYGVLLFDRRGEGASEGRPNSWGWGGDADVRAAAAYLERRADVDPGRIGAIGLSVGGELLIETAAETDDLAAVVSDGAGARSIAEDMHHDHPLIEKWTIGAAMSGARTVATAISGDHAPPADLQDLAAKVDEPLLLIAAPNSRNGETLNRGYARAAGATLWEIPEARHMGGIDARPREYERRVVGFFDAALGAGR